MSIKDLKPAASRLLLSAWSRNPTDSYEDIVVRSGISKFETYLSAKEQLKELGFCREEDDGMVVFLRYDALKTKK